LESKEQKKGNIVVITSERSKRSDDIPYGLTKTASNSFIEGFASKVIGEGIRINGVAPGVTASDMTGVSRDGNMYSEWQPANRFFLPEEVAEVVNFLLSDVSNCISGEIIACDQGRHISHW
jgi:NAD(P)-dependent dehydrogenase (short-subunit alcohol dehydrogenase family)